jgi:hypothetical protein
MARIPAPGDEGGFRMSIRSLLQSLVPWSRPRESVSLNPVEQLALRYLLVYGAATRETIAAEVSATRAEGEGEAEQAIARLQSIGLVETTGEASFAASGKAGKLKERIPIEPRTVMEYYL